MRFMQNKTILSLLSVMIILLTVVYLNHFDNSFQFDDHHTIVSNFYIRSIGNIPKFFVDATTTTSMAGPQYRPLIATVTAIEYWLAGGPHTTWFHVVAYSFFVVQLILMFYFYRQIFNFSRVQPHNDVLALMAVAFFGFHPVIAETVNYLIQQADLLSTLFVVLSFVLYQRYESTRFKGWYLIPVVLACLTKPTGVMAAPLFVVFHFLRDHAVRNQQRTAWSAITVQSLKRSISVLVTCAALFVLISVLTPSTYTPGGSSRLYYALTQPFVILDYVSMLFVPVGLSADTDWKVITSINDPRLPIGVLFLLASAAIIFWAACDRRRFPIAFGLSWFFITLIPTSSVIPLAEVKNDHRMFFPFVGLIPCVFWYVDMILGDRLRAATVRTQQKWWLLAAALILVFSYRTYLRNEVWDTEESLWRDVTIQSPGNGRALMNYGLTKLSTGDLLAAKDYFERAQKLIPYYHKLLINLGIVYGQLGDSGKADYYFIRAIQAASTISEPKLYYARYLLQVANDPVRAKGYFDQVPIDSQLTGEMRVVGLKIYAAVGDRQKLSALVDDTLSIDPHDSAALAYKAALDSNAPFSDIELDIEARALKTADAFVNLSLKAFNQGKMEKVIEFADRAIEINPKSASAYNNKAAAFVSLKRLVEAQQAAQQALSIDPNLQIAKNNLADINRKLEVAGK
jgi:Tfp pilus assembly protein PilF